MARGPNDDDGEWKVEVGETAVDGKADASPASMSRAVDIMVAVVAVVVVLLVWWLPSRGL